MPELSALSPVSRSVSVPPRRRKRRSDAGKFRIHPAIQAKLAELFGHAERLRMAVVQRELQAFCKRARLRMPSRAALYRARALLPLPAYELTALPPQVRESLYNLRAGVRVPPEQIAFYAFNHGSTAAMSFAAKLPVVCLERAAELRGWRPKSLSLLRSVLLCRRA